MLGLLNTVLSKGNTLLTYVKDGLVMANRFLTPPKLTFPAQGSAGFNGTSDYIDLPTDLIEWGNESNSDNPYTIGFWCYANDLVSTSQAPFNAGGYGGGTNNGANVHIKENNILVFNVNHEGDAYRGRAYNATIPEKEWFYFAYTYDGSRVNSGFKIYFNGSRLDDANFTGGTYTAASQTSANNIGRRPNNNDLYWDGNLANVAIWNRALSSDEINSVMWKPVQALSATESNGLQAWYSLDDIASPTASLASMEQLATDKNLTIENKAAVTAAINSLS